MEKATPKIESKKEQKPEEKKKAEPVYKPTVTHFFISKPEHKDDAAAEIYKAVKKARKMTGR